MNEQQPNNTMEAAIAKAENGESGPPVEAGFRSREGFELMLRQAKWLAASNLVPKEFQGEAGMANAVIALEMANRMGASPLAVMQNLYIVHGKPGWSAQFITAAVNTTGKFSPLRFDITGEGDARTCTAWAVELATGERLESPPVSIEMAKAEGWYGKNGSKWQTMPELMLRYRAATFFGRLYAPEVLMGMKTVEEIGDIEPTPEEKAREEIEQKANKQAIEIEPVKATDQMKPGPNGNGTPKAEPKLEPEAPSQPDF